MKNVTVMPGSFKEPSVVTPPEGLTTELWYVTGSDDKDNCLNYGMTIGFDGEDVYLQGLFKELPLTWVHGHQGVVSSRLRKDSLWVITKTGRKLFSWVMMKK